MDLSINTQKHKEKEELNKTETTTTKTDMVNHPPHYEREGAIECIDEMILVFGKDQVSSFCLLNAWKYRYRAGEKNGLEDIKKSDWYMNKYKELKESTESNCGCCISKTKIGYWLAIVINLF